MKLALAALLAALVVLPAASAQVADPSANVNLAPSSPSATIPLGKSATVNITATVTFKNVVCASDGQATVDVTVTDTGLAGVTAPATLSISVAIPKNAPPAVGATPSTDASGLGSAPFTIAVAASAAPNHDHAYTLSGTVKSLPSSCSNPSGTFTSNTATATVAIKTGPAPVTATPTTSTTTAGSATSTTSTQAAFALPLPAILGILAVAGLASRRRD